MRGIWFNTIARIIIGCSQVALGLLMVWLCKYFIDETIIKGTTDDIIQMVALLVSVIVVNIVLRQIHYYLSITAYLQSPVSPPHVRGRAAFWRHHLTPGEGRK